MIFDEPAAEMFSQSVSHRDLVWRRVPGEGSAGMGRRKGSLPEGLSGGERVGWKEGRVRWKDGPMEEWSGGGSHR